MKLNLCMMLFLPTVLWGQVRNELVKKEAVLNCFKEACLSDNFDKEDIQETKITDYYYDLSSNLTHVYFQQFFRGIPVRDGVGSVHFKKIEQPLYFPNQFIQKIKTKTMTIKPKYDHFKGIEQATQALGMPSVGFLERIPSHSEDAFQSMCFFSAALEEQIKVMLTYKIQEDSIYLCWEVGLRDTKSKAYWYFWIDSQNGQVINKYKRTLTCGVNRGVHYEEYLKGEHHKCTDHTLFLENEDRNIVTSFDGQYRIFAPPIESPLFGNRTLELGSSLIDPIASPYGWHDTDGDALTIEYPYTRGNNVYAYYAPAGTVNDPEAIAITRVAGVYTAGNVPLPDNNSLDFDYQNNLNTVLGNSFIEDAITNAFAWTNVCHDIFYRYGFNEQSGNFQDNNHGNGGIGEDCLLVEVQDGGGVNNANFDTPPDGEKPVMQLYLWDTDLPNRILDVSFDNAIITHEYAHGVSFRLIGGPSNTTCLTNFEQGGEGWSDFFGLMLTMTDTDNDGSISSTTLGEGVRTIGTYVLGESASGGGIRPTYYSYNMDCQMAYCNDLTYADITSLAVPHGVGFLWGTMLWDMTMELIGQYGFQPDIKQTNSNAGNIRALRIVMLGLQMTPCNPTFLDMRDAVLAANEVLYGTVDEDLLWNVFARRGLGYSAGIAGNAAFDTPDLLLEKTVNLSDAEIGDIVTYTINVTNNSESPFTNVLISDVIPDRIDVTDISDSGILQASEIIWPIINNLPPGAVQVRSFSGIVNGTDATTIEYQNPVEDFPTPDFTALGLWMTDGGNPNPNTNSTVAWWHLSQPVMTDAQLILDLSLDNTLNNHLAFWHYYDLESSFDGGVIEISKDGITWFDLGSRIVQNGYDGVVFDELITPIGIPLALNPLSGRRTFSGYSGGYIRTLVDLSDYGGMVQIRFRLGANNTNETNLCDESIAGCDGWYIDDVELLDLVHIQNTACATTGQGINTCSDIGPIGTIIYAQGALPLSWLKFDVTTHRKQVFLRWEVVDQVNHKGFEVERKTAKEEWQNIGWIPANESGKHDYLDTAVLPNQTYYYRLRQVDYDGMYSFSEVKAIYIEGEILDVTLHPNPTKSIVHLEWYTPSSSPVDIEVIQANGRTILTKKISNVNTTQLDAGDWPSGVYIVKIQQAESTVCKRLYVQF